jgi:hypothetical protein
VLTPAVEQLTVVEKPDNVPASVRVVALKQPGDGLLAVGELERGDDHALALCYDGRVVDEAAARSTTGRTPGGSV